MSATAPIWLLERLVLALHDAQLMEHGGLTGIRDRGAFESALARPENLFAYGEPDLADLAAAYAFGLARNHPFVDGNKRTSFAACTTFLKRNRQQIPIDEAGNISTWLALASGTLSETELAAWLRVRIQPLD